VVTAAELVALAAFEDGKYATAFPSFGSERMGAPVQSFVRISNLPIRDRSQIQTPDIVIIQDPTLIGNINLTKGLKPDGIVIIDTEKSPSETGLDFCGTILTLPASKIALEKIGRPIQNTTLVGALAGATGLISWESVKKSIMERFPGQIGEKNVAAAWEAFQQLQKVYAQK
jgi:pyruvate ferredoxin oxidoreductase gamma subunit